MSATHDNHTHLFEHAQALLRHTREGIAPTPPQQRRLRSPTLWRKQGNINWDMSSWPTCNMERSETTGSEPMANTLCQKDQRHAASDMAFPWLHPSHHHLEWRTLPRIHVRPASPPKHLSAVAMEDHEHAPARAGEAQSWRPTEWAPCELFCS